jgi:putative ABC transport system permease protein
MDPFTATILALAAAATLGVVVSAVRRPILWRMAVRNALRRPKQTATVVAGLMIGTAIVSSALVAGDSARGAIRGYVYQSLGEVDESIAVQGYPFFPAAAYERLRTVVEDGPFDAVSAHAIWQGAIEVPATGAFEPHAAVVGYEPDRDAGFGVFRLEGGADDGRGLQPGEAIVTGHLAQALQVGPGDTVRLRYMDPIDPILPRVSFGNGTTGLPGPALPGLPVPRPAPPTQQAIEVGPGATLMSVVVAWNATAGPGLPPTVALRPVLTAPDGTVHELPFAPPRGPRAFAVLNVTVPPDRTLAAGNWSLAVEAQGGANVPYRTLALVGYPVYDPELLQERAKALREGAAAAGAESLPGLDAFAATRTTEFRVAAVTTGGRGDLFDLRDALFVRLDEAQRLLGREGEVNLVKFSNPGGPVEGEAGTDAANATLAAALADVKGAYPDLPSVQALAVKPLKRDLLREADSKGQTLTGLLVFSGSLSIITGLLLILNIFTMLAEERRSELGMARAVGLARGDLVRLSVYEGSLYAVAAAAIGALLGLGLAFAMIEVMNAVVSRLSRDLTFPAIQYSPSLTAFLVAFALGALLTFATILVASRRQARLNVVRAIRRLDEPAVTGSRTLAFAAGLPLAVLGLAVGVAAWFPATRELFQDHRFALQVAGPLVAALGLGLLLRPWTRRHLLVPLLAAAMALYYAVTFFVVTEFENRTEANVVGPIRGVLLTLAVVILAVHFERGLRFVGEGLGRLRGLRALALPALSYPLHRKFRTGMTVAMFSVVLLSIGFFSIFGALFQVDPARQTGGFDIEARATLTVESLDAVDRHLPEKEAAVARTIELAEHRTEDRAFITVEGARVGTFRDYRHVVYGFGEDFAATQRFRLTERLPEYATDAEAYAGVLRHQDDAQPHVIVSYIYSTSPEGQAFAHHAGDTLEMHFGEQTLRFTIAGIQEQYHFPGVFVAKPFADAQFPGTARVYLFTLKPGADAEAAARALEANYRDVGLDARSTVAEVLEEQESFRQLLGAMKLFLGLGLLVGVLSLGIVTSRSVLERRQEIGMMRALGYTGRQVRGVFFLEVTATILLGTLVGIACAILVTYGLWFAVVRQLNYPYVIPWGEVALLVAVSYAVALLATWAPIGRTAKVTPAEALRYVE